MKRMAKITVRSRRSAIATLFAVVGVAICIAWLGSRAAAKPPKGAPSAPAAAASPAADAGASSATTARIEFTTVPSTHATVTWGSVVLGHIAPGRPLVVVRPRDSGPLDVTVHARGFLTVHTRAHTFADSKVAVKLTRPSEKATLFGYRAPVDAGPPDAGPPTSASGAPVQPAPAVPAH
jgi:hypothetical protein